MQFRSRFRGELKFTELPAAGQKFALGQSRQVKQGQNIEFSEDTVLRFEDSFRAHVKAGLLVPIDVEARAFFKG